MSDFTKFSVLVSTYSSSGISATNFWHFTLMWWCCRWFMPVNILLTFIIGSVLAWILIKITRTPPHLQGLVIGCCSAGNLGNLLLIIVPAVCNESNSPFGDSTVCSSYGMAYASLSMAVRFYLHHVTKENPSSDTIIMKPTFNRCFQAPPSLDHRIQDVTLKLISLLLL